MINKIINYLNGFGPNFGVFVMAVGGVLVISLILFLLYKWESKHATTKYCKMYKDNIS
jgi:hypothetical protein